MIEKVIEAIQAGKELQNPATWKNRQTTASLLLVLLGIGSIAAKAFFGVEIPDSLIKDAAEIGAIVLGGVNAYFINATSKKVGI